MELPVPASALSRSARRDDIPAIVDPAFGEDWHGIELTVTSDLGEPYPTRPRLHPEDLVVGLEMDGTAKAYPVKVLQFHEVVNDHFATTAGDRAVVVTYCPLCRSALAARPVVNGRTTEFGVDGRLWRGNLVLYDRATESLWSQLLAMAIRGPATGDRLDLLPATLTTWTEWREAHPETVVLRPPPESETVVGDDLVLRDYASNPYSQYDDSQWVPTGEFSDSRLHPKAVVLGIAVGDRAKAYPLSAVLDADVINDTVGDVPVVVTATGQSITAYRRRLDGQAVTFRAAGPAHLAAADSTWSRRTGLAIDGSFEGSTLEPATSHSSLFWFAWLAQHPDSSVYRNPSSG